MTKLKIAFAAGFCGLTGLAVQPAVAADVRGELTPELIYEHCQAAGVGSETEGTFMLPGGQRVTGTVLCAAEDLVAPKLTSMRGHDDDDDDDDEDHRDRHHGEDHHDDDHHDRHDDEDDRD